MFKKIIITLGVLFALLIGAIASAPLWLDLEAVKNRVIAEAEKATSRDFNIAGDLSLKFYPYIGFSAQKVSLSNAPAFTETHENMLTIERLGVAIEVLPLLAGRINLDHLIVDNPTINLAQTKSGENNWTFPKTSSQKTTAQKNKTAEEKTQKSSSSPTLPAGLALNDIRLINGTLSYQAGDIVQTLTSINAEIDLPALDKPLHINGRLNYNDKPVQADVTLDNLTSLTANKVTKIALKASFDNQQINSNGEITLSADQDLTYDFDKLELRTPALSLSGHSQGTVISKAEPISADMALHLTSAQVNLPKNATDAQAAESKTVQPVIQEAKEAAATKIVWPKDTLPLDVLNTANLKAAVTFDAITLDGIKLQDGDINIDLQNGKLSASVQKLKAFDGDIKALVNGNAKGNFGLDISLDKLSVSALNKQLGQELPVAGNISSAATYKTSGQHMAAMIANLDGTFNFELLGAGLSGTDAKTMLSTYGGPFGMALLQTVDSQALSRLNDRVSSVIIKSETFSGVMDLTSVQVLTPIAELAGEGNIHLPNSTINLHMTPRMLMDVSTHSKTLDAVVANLRTPFYIRGDLLAPKVQLDQEALGKNLMRESIKSGLDKAIRDLDDNDNPLMRDGLNVLRGFFGDKEAK